MWQCCRGRLAGKHVNYRSGRRLGSFRNFRNAGVSSNRQVNENTTATELEGSLYELRHMCELEVNYNGVYRSKRTRIFYTRIELITPAGVLAYRRGKVERMERNGDAPHGHRRNRQRASNQSGTQPHHTETTGRGAAAIECGVRTSSAFFTSNEEAHDLRAISSLTSSTACFTTF